MYPPENPPERDLDPEEKGGPPSQRKPTYWESVDHSKPTTCWEYVRTYWREHLIATIIVLLLMGAVAIGVFMVFRNEKTL